MPLMVHCNFDKSKFSKYSFGRVGGGGGHTKDYSVYALDNVDNSGRALYRVSPWQHFKCV